MSTEPLRFPSIEGLRAFEAAARLGSLERAAEALCISASAVSKRISTLEELLGAALLARSAAKPLTLTAAGKEYLPQVRQVLDAMAAIPLHRRALQRGIERLRVAAPPTFARQILVPALPAFTEAHPEIELELLLSTPFLDEAAPEAEVEIGNSIGDGAEAQVLMHDEVTPMAAPALLERLAQAGTPLHEPADLRHAPLLRTPIEPWTPWLRAAGLDWPEPSHGTRFVDLGLTLEAAAHGQGIALGRPSLAAAWLRSGALRRLFELNVPAQTAYVLRVHAAESTGAQAFAAWLCRHCAALDRA